MPSSNHQSTKRASFQLEQLRMDAEDRLDLGSAPQTNGWSLGADTLALLYQLASSPDTASHALKLLHELQVHQVELDLQHEQLKSLEEEAAEALSRYRTFYEFAPVAYFALSPGGLVIEANRAGASLFGMEPDDLRDQRIENFLAPASRTAVIGLFERLREGATEASCQAQAAADTQGSHAAWRISASAPPRRGIVLMTVSGQG